MSNRGVCGNCGQAVDFDEHDRDACRALIKPCVYVLCFAKTPYKHARHYTGMTTLPIAERIKRHRDHRGAKLLQKLLSAGGDFVLADTWECETAEEARQLERTLKGMKSGSRLCSICTPGNGRGGGRGRNRYGINGKPAKVA